MLTKIVKGYNPLSMRKKKFAPYSVIKTSVRQTLAFSSKEPCLPLLSHFSHFPQILVVLSQAYHVPSSWNTHRDSFCTCTYEAVRTDQRLLSSGSLPWFYIEWSTYPLLSLFLLHRPKFLRRFCSLSLNPTVLSMLYTKCSVFVKWLLDWFCLKRGRLGERRCAILGIVK